MKKLFFLAFSLILCTALFAQNPPEIEPEAEQTTLTEASELEAATEVTALKAELEAAKQEIEKLQPTVEEDLTGIAKLWAWLKDNWLLVSGLILGIGEILARAFPTDKNLARFEWLLKIIDFLTNIFGNNKTGGGQHAKA